MKHLGDALASAFTGPGLDNPGAVRFSLDAATERMRLRLVAGGAGTLAIESAVESAHIATRLGLPLCESPIERTLLPALICADFNAASAGPASVHIAKHKPLPDVPVVIVPQLAVLNYRLDFAVVLRAGGHRFTFAVECDGGAYHESVKDIERDRVLKSWGIGTVRLRGSEIHIDPIAAANKATADILSRLDYLGARL